MEFLLPQASSLRFLLFLKRVFPVTTGHTAARRPFPHGWSWTGLNRRLPRCPAPTAIGCLGSDRQAFRPQDGVETLRIGRAFKIGLSDFRLAIEMRECLR